jgi:hypothetical protein
MKKAWLNDVYWAISLIRRSTGISRWETWLIAIQECSPSQNRGGLVLYSRYQADVDLFFGSIDGRLYLSIQVTW